MKGLDHAFGGFSAIFLMPLVLIGATVPGASISRLHPAPISAPENPPVPQRTCTRILNFPGLRWDGSRCETYVPITSRSATGATLGKVLEKMIVPCSAAAMQFLSAAPATVSIHTLDPEAVESNFAQGEADWDKLGVFEIRRTGDIQADLTVFFEVGGTAKRQEDYILLPGIEWFPCVCDRMEINFLGNTIVIPAGASSFRLGVQALPDQGLQMDETVVITLLDDPRAGPLPSYQLGDPRQATVLVTEFSGNMPLAMYSRGEGHLQFVVAQGSLLQGRLELELSHDLVTWNSLGPFSPGNVAAFAEDTVPPNDKRPRFYRSALTR
jgi:hypothetical protein